MSDRDAVDVRLLADRAAIEEVCVRYARALDRRDWALLRTCFAPDVKVEYEGMEPLDGYEAVEDVCRGALEPLDASHHLLGNFSIEVRGDDAWCECYLQAQHVRAGTEAGDQYIVAGRYVDTLRRAGEGWRITSRRLEVVWTSGNPAVLGP